MAVVRIPVRETLVRGDLDVPPGATGIVIIVDDVDQGRVHPMHRAVARELRGLGFATLQLHLTDGTRTDVPRMADCVHLATEWLATTPTGWSLRPGFLGAHAAASAVLVAAAVLGARVGAVVTEDGRTDLAGSALGRVAAPTLLLVAECDDDALEVNREAFAGLRCDRQIEIVPGVARLGADPASTAQTARHVTSWFRRHLH